MSMASQVQIVAIKYKTHNKIPSHLIILFFEKIIDPISIGGIDETK